MQPAFVRVILVVEMTPDRELNVSAYDDLTAQNGVAVVADAGCMVSGCHAGDVDSAASQLVNVVRLHSSLGYRPPAAEAVLTSSHSIQTTT